MAPLRDATQGKDFLNGGVVPSPKPSVTTIVKDDLLQR